MKKAISALMAVCLTISTLAVTGCAENPAESGGSVIVLTIGEPIMKVNGEEKEIDPGADTAPVIINERTLLPVRAVIEELGGSAQWSGADREVILNKDDNEIRLTIESTTAYLNGEEYTLDTAPVIINDRTMLPIRFIAESLGLGVDWNGETQEVTLTMNNDEKSTAPEMSLIEGGTFTMGSPESEAERDSDEILHRVTLSSYHIAQKEVSQAEYRAVTGENPSFNKGDELPVENITWYDAIDYCNALSVSEGLEQCYSVSGNTVVWNREANGYRLPTEAEWEYACRSGAETPFSFGDYVEDTDANCYNAYGYNNDASGNWVNGYLEHTVNVDEYSSNGYGVYNMHGNVAEWVWDWYGAYGGDESDPAGPESGNYKVARGGGWNDFPKHIRSAYRSAYPADAPLYSIGLRVARSASSLNETVTSTDKASAQPHGKTLIVYFSQTGNTDGLARIIQEMTGADMFRIERETPYSSEHNSQSLYAEALEEYRENASPALRAYPEESGIDVDSYDTIMVGYCNWWASIPAPVRTFLERYDFSDKTIIPFCSMGGGRFGQTISAIAKLEPNSTIKEGLCVTYSSYDREAIADWLAGSGVIGSDTVRVSLEWNGGRAEMVLEDNATTRDFISKLPMTLNIEDFNNTEKIGYMDNTLIADDEARGCDPEPGTVALYAPWGNLSIFYKDWDASDDLVSMGYVESGLEQIEAISENTEITFTLAE